MPPTSIPEPPSVHEAAAMELSQGGRVNLTRNSILNLLGEGIPMGVSFVAVRMLIGRLGDERYGVLVVAWAVMAYLSLVDLGMGRALTQSVARKVAAGGSPTSLVWTGLAMILALGTAGGAVLALATPAVVGWLRVPEALAGEARGAFHALAVSLPLLLVTAGLRGVLEALNKFGLLSGVKCVTGTAVLVVPLMVLPFTVNLAAVVGAAVAVRLAGMVMHAAACGWALREAGWRSSGGGGRLTRGSAGELFRFGRWLTLDNVAGPAMVFADRWCVSRVAGASAVGYYGTPVDLVLRLLFIPVAIAAVLFPAFTAGLAGRGDTPAAALDRGSRLLGAVLFPVALLLAALAPEAVSAWLGAEWSAHAARVLQLAAVGLFIGGMTMGPIALLQAGGRPDVPALFHTLELPLHVAVLMVLTTRWGIQGTATALVIRVAIDHVAMAIMLPRTVRMAAGVGRVMGRVSGWTAAGALCLLGVGCVESTTGRLLWLAGILPLFLVVAYLRLLHREELEWVWGLVRRRPAVSG